MKENDAVPENLKDKITIRVILLIAGAFGIFYGIINIIDKTTSLYMIDIVFVVNPLVTSISAFVVAGFYKMSKVMGFSYIFLGIGMLCGAIGEAIYSVQSVLLQIDPFPSIADGFFLAQSFFWMAHVVTNLKYFKQTISHRHLMIFIGIFTVIITSYLVSGILSQKIESSFEFYYGLIFVIIAGILLPLFLYAAITFRGGLWGSAWNLLLLGMILTIIGDVWYYHLELTGEFDDWHPVMLLWFIGFWIQTYSLWKHRKLLSEKN
jgi:hypothetical protein